MVGIYKITNPLTKKSYIGSSNNIGIRFTKHKSDLRLGKHHSSKLQNSYNKHGDIFIYDIIEECKVEVLLDREQYYIDLFDSYKNGYNSSSKSMYHNIGNKNGLGKILSDETKKRISDKLKEYYLINGFTEEHRNKMSKARKGVKLTEEHKNSMSRARKGIKLTEEHKNKLSISKLNKNNRCKKIATISEEGCIIREYKSVKECSLDISLDCRRISDVLKGVYTSYKGYKFIYL